MFDPQDDLTTKESNLSTEESLIEFFHNRPIPENECVHCGLSLKECVQWSPDGCPDAP